MSMGVASVRACVCERERDVHVCTYEDMPPTNHSLHTHTHTHTQYGKLEGGLLVEVPAYLVRKMKQHFHPLGDLDLHLILSRSY